ncbi:MAG: hypothetical protein AB7D29_01990 [Campylobacterales bacterium]
MRTSLSEPQLLKYLEKQISNLFPDEMEICLSETVPSALKKIEYCFAHILLKHYRLGGQIYFNHLNADHYVVFIYFCSNIAYKTGDINLASKLFYLNKTLHGFHCMYDTELPDIFLVIHGGGIVLGKAKYSNYFFVAQGCTVGANGHCEYPILGEGVVMYPNSSIVGKSRIGQNSCLSNGAFVNNCDIEKDTLVIDRSPNLILKPNRADRLSTFFKISPSVI